MARGLATIFSVSQPARWVCSAFCHHRWPSPPPPPGLPSCLQRGFSSREPFLLGVCSQAVPSLVGPHHMHPGGPSSLHLAFPTVFYPLSNTIGVLLCQPLSCWPSEAILAPPPTLSPSGVSHWVASWCALGTVTAPAPQPAIPPHLGLPPPRTEPDRAAGAILPLCPWGLRSRPPRRPPHFCAASRWYGRAGEEGLLQTTLAGLLLSLQSSAYFAFAFSSESVTSAGCLCP